MPNAAFTIEDGILTLVLSGNIDSTNSTAVEAEINQILAANDFETVVIDASNLNYISSAGLRVILRLLKAHPSLSIENASTDIYEVLDMTGFTELMQVSKAYRVLDVEGCEVIGRGANGRVYRINPDTIVKVYFNPDALPEIQRERELARTAFVLGIPTAIPYDVVRVGNGYGSVFEMLNAKSLATLLSSGEKSVDEVAIMLAELIALIHGTEVKDGSMPNMRTTALGWVEFLADYLPADKYAKLHALVDAVPESLGMLHGDYHLKNVMYQNGECLLIDMDTLCHGHPIFELGSMYNALRGFSEINHDNIAGFIGIDFETGTQLWHKFLSLYLHTEDDERIREVERKAQVIGYTRLLRRSIRRQDTENHELDIPYYRERLIGLLGEVDSLVF